MNAPTVDMKDLIAVGGLGLTFGTNLFIGLQPDTPDLCVTLYDTGGWRDPSADNDLYYPMLQVRIRASRGGYRTAHAKASQVRVFISDLSPQTVNGTQYGGFWPTTDLLFVGYDNTDRPMFTVNFRLMRSGA